MNALLIQLSGVTAHFRDPRINTAKIGLPARTLRCPPPCTVHGLLCAAKGGWIEPDTLHIGWQTDYASTATDLQSSHLPQRERTGPNRGNQVGVNVSPVAREFLAFPTLSLLVLGGVDPEWFRKPANPLSLGRSEDLIVAKQVGPVAVTLTGAAEIERQCLPVGVGSGTIYVAPLYFEGNRRPVGMAPKTDAVRRQRAAVTNRESAFAVVQGTKRAFYLWRFSDAAG